MIQLCGGARSVVIALAWVAGTMVVAGCARGAPAACAEGPAAAAASNAASMTSLFWSPFRRPETGWQAYEPLIAHEIGASCPGDSPAFAARLAAWQAGHKLAPSGLLDAATLQRLITLWQSRRPFVAQSQIACPPPADVASLAQAAAAESYGGKVVLLAPPALAAYRRMVAAARAEDPAIGADHQMLAIFSGFRSPEYDAARCAAHQYCQAGTKTSCSAHRTALAMDLVLSTVPGTALDSTDSANRLVLSRSAPYRWLVANAARFGFANYPFEPWHWEWTGQAN